MVAEAFYVWMIMGLKWIRGRDVTAGIWKVEVDSKLLVAGKLKLRWLKARFIDASERNHCSDGAPFCACAYTRLFW